jgi:PAS domain S-box-containing protein
MTKTTILVVENEAIVAMDLAAKLRQLGYEVAGTAAEGEAAVALACRLRPHLVLMDIRLEGPMDGIQAAEAIRSQYDVPVVYLTAHSDAATLGRAKLTGPFGYILKPFEERELAIQIEMALYQHQADRRLRQQREWLRVTLTSIGDAVIATDAGLRISFVNPVAESLTGWPAADAVGQPLTSVFRIINEQTGRPLEEPVTRALRERRVVALANHAALVTKDGRTVPIEDSAAPILDAAGQVIGAVLVFHDVTEKRRAVEALRKAHDDLEKRVHERTSELSTAVQSLQAEIVQRKRLEATLRESENQVRFFASQCLTAQESERKRIAGELHDSISASLAATKFGIERASEEMKRGHGDPESLKNLATSLTGIINEVRRIMADLRPSILDDLGILAALNWFCREYQKTYSHISVEKQIGIEEQEVPDSLKTPIFRISQEAMNNSSKHSQASLVRLSLQKEDSKILLIIQDNGQGFNPQTARKGLGLSSVRERAHLSGGDCIIESAEGAGTTVRCSWPI